MAQPGEAEPGETQHLWCAIHCPAGDCKAICRKGDSDHKFSIAPNLLDRNFAADAPDQKWAGDISYVWTREGWLYLAVILDLHSRRVIGWAVSNRMKRDLAIRALKIESRRVCRRA